MPRSTVKGTSFEENLRLKLQFDHKALGGGQNHRIVTHGHFKPKIHSRNDSWSLTQELIT